MHEPIYIKKTTIIDDVEETTFVLLTDFQEHFIDELNANQLKMYTNVSGTISLLAGGLLLTSHHIKANGNLTVDMDLVPDNSTVYLMLEQDGTGGHTITLPDFDNLDTQPSVTTVAGKMDVLIIMKMNNDIHLHSLVRHTETF